MITNNNINNKLLDLSNNLFFNNPLHSSKDKKGINDNEVFLNRYYQNFH